MNDCQALDQQLDPDPNTFYQVIKQGTSFLACDSIYAIARYAIARPSVCPSVRLSVCLSVCHTGGSAKNG